MMVARTPTQLEIEVAAEVAAEAFPNLSLEHWRESFYTAEKMFGREFIVVVELDGKIVSSLLCCPAPIHVGKGMVSHSSVGGVGTLTDYRKKGCAGALMVQTVKMLREQRIHTSSLWPFSYEYYRKFGWEVGSEVRHYSAESKVFAQMGDATSVRTASAEDLGGIKSAYDFFASDYNCLTQRSDEWWTNITRLKPEHLAPATQDARGTVVHQTGDRVDGYAVYGHDAGTSIDVKEMFFVEPRHRRDMLTFFAALDPEARINFDAPLDDHFMHELSNPRAVEITVNPSFQFRVIDPREAMLALVSDECISNKISLSISDPVFEEGFEFGIDIEQGRATQCPYDANHALKMDVQTFAKLYSGYLSPLEGWLLGKIKIPGDLDALARACEAFSPLAPYRTWLEPG